MNNNNTTLALILLSTFNGQKYIRDQLDSIVKQSYKNWRLIIRDDCSTDNTVSILNEYVSEFDNIELMTDTYTENLNVCSSYFELVYFVKEHYQNEDYILFFCDQDDVWSIDKLEISLLKINELESKYSKKLPLLIHHNVTVTDESLNFISKGFINYRSYKISLQKNQAYKCLVFQNFITGCTMCINKAAVNIISLKNTRDIIMHDWYLGLLVAATGRIVFLDESLLFYRQHNNNALGATFYNFKSKFYNFINSFHNINKDMVKCLHQLNVCSTILINVNNANVLWLLNLLDIYKKNKLSRMTSLFYLGNYPKFLAGRKIFRFYWIILWIMSLIIIPNNIIGNKTDYIAEESKK